MHWQIGHARLGETSEKWDFQQDAESRKDEVGECTDRERLYPVCQTVRSPDEHSMSLTLERQPEEHDLCDVEKQRPGYSGLYTFHEPHLDAVDVFPGSQSSQATKCNETFNGSDFDAGPFWPGFVPDGVENECKTVKEESETGKKEKR